MLQYSEKAYAKINLTLDIKGVDERGYHYVNTVMQTVSLFDKISILIQINLHGAIKLLCYDSSFPSDENNIVYKAATAFFLFTKINNPGVCIRLNKKIPKSSGLGGGSSDAAATLRILNVLFNAKLSAHQLESIAATLGSDVPFCIRGGTQYATGFGEQLKIIENSLGEELYIILIKSAKKPSTREMYSRIDEYENIDNCSSKAVIECLENGDYLAAFKHISNSFSAAWSKSILGSICTKMQELGAVATNITGSGPTVYGIFTSKKEVEVAAKKLRLEHRNVYITKFQPPILF